MTLETAAANASYGSSASGSSFYAAMRILPPAQREAIVELRQSDEEEREQGARVPLVVEQDVEVIEGVGVQEVSLVEEEDGVHAILAELLDVRADGVEDGRRGGHSDRDGLCGDRRIAVADRPLYVAGADVDLCGARQLAAAERQHHDDHEAV